MANRAVYLTAGVAVLVVAVGAVVAFAQSHQPNRQPGELGPDEFVSPTDAPAGQLEGDELREYWNDERISEARPMPMPTPPPADE